MLPKFLKPRIFVNLKRIGSKNDGGYFVPKKIIHQAKNLITCGLGFNWDFEKKFYKLNPFCKIIVYDQSVNFFTLLSDLIKSLIFSIRYRKEFKKIFKIIDYYYFFSNFAVHHKSMVGNKIKKNFIKLDKIIGNKKQIILKIDIEGDEYNILNTIKKFQKNIICLIIEFHKIKSNFKTLKGFINNNDLIICNICPNNSLGVDKEDDPKVIEVTFINKKLLKKNDFTIKGNSKCVANNPYKEINYIRFKK